MRTKAFESFIRGQLGGDKQGWLTKIGRLSGIAMHAKLGRKSSPKRGPKKLQYGLPEPKKPQFGEAGYRDWARYDIVLRANLVMMTVEFDGVSLTFSYFGLESDENSDTCLLKEYKAAEKKVGES